ncbi:tetratricopeptide repeat protein [Streptomyces olivochromogenes]|nr:tetratricopeptide repeat protein [Streptomyces olivochromogenes]
MLHPLVREVMALLMPGIDSLACLTAMDAHLIRAVNDTDQAGRAGLTTARLLTPHLAAALIRAPADHFATTRDAVNALANNVSDALLLIQHMLDAESRHLAPNDPEILGSRDFLASTLIDLGHYREATDLHQQTLTDRERTLGPNHPLTQLSRQNLASAEAAATRTRRRRWIRRRW